MVRLAPERVLLVGDAQRELHAALAQGAPRAEVTRVESVFDAIAELSNGAYTTVLVAAEPIARRPDAAVRTLRELVGEGKLVLFGDAGTEPLSRRMLRAGCDDYLVMPAGAAEVRDLLGAAAPMRLVAPAGSSDVADASESAAMTVTASGAGAAALNAPLDVDLDTAALLPRIPLADLL